MRGIEPVPARTTEDRFLNLGTLAPSAMEEGQLCGLHLNCPSGCSGSGASVRSPELQTFGELLSLDSQICDLDSWHLPSDPMLRLTDGQPSPTVLNRNA